MYKFERRVKLKLLTEGKKKHEIYATKYEIRTLVYPWIKRNSSSTLRTVAATKKRTHYYYYVILKKSAIHRIRRSKQGAIKTLMGQSANQNKRNQPINRGRESLLCYQVCDPAASSLAFCCWRSWNRRATLLVSLINFSAQTPMHFASLSSRRLLRKLWELVHWVIDWIELGLQWRRGYLHWVVLRTGATRWISPLLWPNYIT